METYYFEIFILIVYTHVSIKQFYLQQSVFKTTRLTICKDDSNIFEIRKRHYIPIYSYFLINELKWYIDSHNYSLKFDN